MKNIFSRRNLNVFILISFNILEILSAANYNLEQRLDKDKLFENIEHLCREDHKKLEEKYKEERRFKICMFEDSMCLATRNQLNEIYKDSIDIGSKKKFIMHVQTFIMNEEELKQNIHSFLYYFKESIANNKCKRYFSGNSENNHVIPDYYDFKSKSGNDSKVFIGEVENGKELESAFKHFKNSNQKISNLLKFCHKNIIIISDCTYSELSMDRLESLIPEETQNHNYIFTIMEQNNDKEIEESIKLEEFFIRTTPSFEHSSIEVIQMQSDESESEQDENINGRSVKGRSTRKVGLCEIVNFKELVKFSKNFTSNKKTIIFNSFVYSLELETITRQVGLDAVRLSIKFYKNDLPFVLIFYGDVKYLTRVYCKGYNPKLQFFDVNQLLKNLRCLTNKEQGFKKIYQTDFDFTTIGQEDIFPINPYQIRKGFKYVESLRIDEEFKNYLDVLRQNVKKICAKNDDAFEIKTFSISEKDICEGVEYSDKKPADMCSETENDGPDPFLKFLGNAKKEKLSKLKDTILFSGKKLLKNESEPDIIFSDSSKEVNLVISVSSKRTSAYFEIFLSLQKIEDKNKLELAIGLSHSPLIFKPFYTSYWIEELVEGLNFEFSH